MTKQELLQKRAAHIAAADTILLDAESKGEFTEEQEAQVKGLQKQAEDIDRLLAARSNIDESNKAFPAPAIIPELHKDGDKDNGGFKCIGEFIHAIRFGDKSGRLAGITQKQQSMSADELGGYLVPEQFSTDLMRLSEDASIVRQRATVIPAGDPPDATLHIPVLDYSKNMQGGVETTWIGEGEEKPATEAKFTTIDLTPRELAGTITVTDKLLRNWSAAGALFNTLLSEALAIATDMAHLKGDGAGKPTGVYSALNTGLKEVPRSTTGMITLEDVLNMLVATKMDGEEYVWITHQTALPALVTLRDAAGNYIFLRGDATKGIPDMLMGRPVFFTGRTFPLGTRGDLALFDFKKYLIKDGSGPYLATSEHVHFKQNRTVIKAFLNVDGKPWISAPIKLADGVTEVSPYIVLGA